MANYFNRWGPRPRGVGHAVPHAPSRPVYGPTSAGGVVYHPGGGTGGVGSGVAAQVAWQPPTSAPPGSFDPALKAQGDNAAQGYLWAGEDYGLGKLQRSLDMYGDPSLGTAGTVGQINQQYQQQLANTNKSFGNLALGQADQQARAGVDEGGAAAQAAGKRQANWRDIVGQLDYSHGQALASAQQAFDRANNAADTTFQRAGVTNTMFGQQLNDEEVYAAQLAGRLPVAPPNALTHQSSVPTGTRRDVPLYQRMRWGGYHRG